MDDTDNWDEKKVTTLLRFAGNIPSEKKPAMSFGMIESSYLSKKNSMAELLPADFINWFANGCKKKSQNS